MCLHCQVVESQKQTVLRNNARLDLANKLAYNVTYVVTN